MRIGKPYQHIQLAREAQINRVVMAVRARETRDLAAFGSTTYRVLQSEPRPAPAVRV